MLFGCNFGLVLRGTGSYHPRAKGKGTAHQTGAPFAGRPGLPRSLRVAPFYSQPERLNPNHSPLHTTAIPTRTVS